MAKIQQQIDRLYSIFDRRLRGWPSLFLRTALAFDQDDGAVMSRSIAYYALFSLFPLMLVLMSFATSILAANEAQELIVELVERFLPSTADLVQANADQIILAQNTVGILALIGLLWSASGVFTAIYRSVNRAWGNPKSKLFWSEKLFGLAVVIIVGLLLISTTFFSTAVSLLRSWNLEILDWQPFADPDVARTWGLISTLLPILVSLFTFSILYRTIPRNPVTWRDVWVGGIIAGTVWELARRLYTWYLANIATYSLIYGSVGAIIGFLLWAYLSAMILLIGAEFTAQYAAWRNEGHPLEPRPLGQWINEWSKWKNQQTPSS